MSVKKPEEPAWQRAQRPTAPVPTEADLNEAISESNIDRSTEEHGKTSPEPASAQTESTLLEHASKFLQDGGVKEAPRERKIEFLLSKGFSRESVEALLDSFEKQQDARSGRRQDGDGRYTILTAEQRTNSSTPPSAPFTGTTASREIVPIITYPEFLTHPQQSPPLITADRLLTIAYVTGGMYSLLYGASEYLVQPMVESLTKTRQEYTSHAQGNLKHFNEKLAKLVSRYPSTSAVPAQGEVSEGEAVSDTSDPTELFHRDFGTQTEPPHSLMDLPQSPSEDSPLAATSKQDTSLKSIQSYLHSLRSSNLVCSESDSSSDDPLKASVAELSKYIDELTFNTTTTYGNVGYGKAKENDGIEKFRNEIRGIKGMLLSARNFPKGGGTLSGGTLR